MVTMATMKLLLTTIFVCFLGAVVSVTDKEFMVSVASKSLATIRILLTTTLVCYLVDREGKYFLAFLHSFINKPP